MKHIYLFVIVLLLFSCSNESEHTTSDNNTQVMDTIHSKNDTSIHERKLLEIDKNLFIHSNIKMIDSLNDFDATTCRPMTEQEYYSAFQYESDGAYDPENNAPYYYANQGFWKGYSRFIFVKKDETCCTVYHYNLYDSSGKQTGTFVVAAEGGDGGWEMNKEPVFLNDSTIKTITVECEYGMDESGNESGDCDSTIIVYHIRKDGSIRETKESMHKITK